MTALGSEEEKKQLNFCVRSTQLRGLTSKCKSRKFYSSSNKKQGVYLTAKRPPSPRTHTQTRAHTHIGLYTSPPPPPPTPKEEEEEEKERSLNIVWHTAISSLICRRRRGLYFSSDGSRFDRSKLSFEKLN